MATEQTLTQTPIKLPMDDANAAKSDEDAAPKDQQVVTESNGSAEESKTKSSNIFEGRKFDWWTDGKSSMYGLFRMNEIRLPMVKETLLGDKKPEDEDKPLSGFTIMDVGCGGGLLCEPIANLGAQVTGIDISKESVEAAEEHMRKFSPDLEKNLKYINISIEDLIKQQNYEQYDAVIASEVAEHVVNLEEFTIGCLKLVKPGGHFLVTTINKTFAAYLRYILIDEKILHRLPSGTHPYNMLVPPAKLKAIVEKNGFVVKCIRGFMCNPVTRKWSWSKTTAVNYFLVAQRKEDQDQDQNESEKPKTEEESEKKTDQEK